MKYQQKYQQQQPSQQSDQQESRLDQEYSESASSQEQQQLMNAEMERIKHQLKTVPYELILKQNATGTAKTESASKLGPTKKLAKKIKKAKFVVKQKHQKNEAVQVSIRQKPRKKQVNLFDHKRKKGIDPRFEQYAGHYNQDLSMKSYNFIPKLQQAEIHQLKSKLKNQTKRHKISSHEREVLQKEYNRITSDYKKVQLMQLEKSTKKELKEKHGEGYHLNRQEFKHQFEKKKFLNMNDTDRDKKIRDKEMQINKNHINQRRKTLHFKTYQRR